MDAKPNVLITTYRSNPSKLLNMQATRNKQEDNMKEATKSDISTNFFGQCKRLQARNKILTDLNQILGPTGSVRGHKDVVRRSLEGIKIVSRRQNFGSPNQLSTFSPMSSIMSSSYNGSTTGSSLNGNIKAPISWQLMDELYCAEMLQRMSEDERDLCVIYTTSLGVIRRTFEDSKSMRAILDLNLISYQERDIYLNQEYKNQLRLRCKAIIVPALFVDGEYIGGFKELESMNENKELNRLLAKFKMSKASNSNCKCCGNAKFIACPTCNGSRKSAIHHFKFNSIALRCIKCNKNDGLVQCPVCNNDKTHENDQKHYFNLRRETEQSNQLSKAHVLTDIDNNIIVRPNIKLDDINRLHSTRDNNKSIVGSTVLTNWNGYKSNQSHRTCRNTSR